MRDVIKYLFHLFRSCSSLSKAPSHGWSGIGLTHLSQPSINNISGKEHDDDEDAVPWNQLPMDILRLIFERLDLVDRNRFDLVCKRWRSSTTQTPQLPWPMLPHEQNCQHLSFFDLSEGKVHDLKLPESAQGG
ncbi:hypothetical protein PTKIN_Ptkin10aG0174600 [Pterospermum kingtungense]